MLCAGRMGLRKRQSPLETYVPSRNPHTQTRNARGQGRRFAGNLPRGVRVGRWPTAKRIPLQRLAGVHRTPSTRQLRIDGALVQNAVRDRVEHWAVDRSEARLSTGLRHEHRVEGHPAERQHGADQADPPGGNLSVAVFPQQETPCREKRLGNFQRFRRSAATTLTGAG